MSTENIWPPPPDIAPEWAGRVNCEYMGRTRLVSDMRNGYLKVTAAGVTLDGKAVLPAEIQAPIVIGSLLAFPSFLVVSFLLEYGVRTHRDLTLSWDEIEGIVVDPGGRDICLVYRGKTRKDEPRLFSLTFADKRAVTDALADVLRYYAPGKVAAGWVPFQTHLHVRLFCAWLILAVAALLFWMYFGRP